MSQTRPTPYFIHFVVTRDADGIWRADPDTYSVPKQPEPLPPLHGETLAEVVTTAVSLAEGLGAGWTFRQADSAVPA